MGFKCLKARTTSRRQFNFYQSFQKFLALVFTDYGRMNLESTLKPPSDFEHGTSGLGMQHLNPLRANFTKWSNTLKQFVGKLPTNCLSVFEHFVGLALKGLTTRPLRHCSINLNAWM